MSRTFDANGEGCGPTLQLVDEVGDVNHMMNVFRCHCSGFEEAPHVVIIPRSFGGVGMVDLDALDMLSDILRAMSPLLPNEKPRDVGALMKQHGITLCFSVQAFSLCTGVISEKLRFLPAGLTRFDGFVKNLMKKGIEPPGPICISLFSCLSLATSAMTQRVIDPISDTLARR